MMLMEETKTCNCFFDIARVREGNAVMHVWWTYVQGTHTNRKDARWFVLLYPICCLLLVYPAFFF